MENQMRKSLSPTNTKSPDNDEVTTLELTPTLNGFGAFNYIGGYMFYDEKEAYLVGKTDLESMLDEIGFGAAP